MSTYLLDLLYQDYARNKIYDKNNAVTSMIEKELELLEFGSVDNIMSLANQYAAKNEKEGFIAGIRIGVKLKDELYEET